MLMDQNFRRSGDLFYRPECDGCAACIAIRVPVAEFAPSRAQRRALHKSADVRVTEDNWRELLKRRDESEVYCPDPAAAILPGRFPSAPRTPRPPPRQDITKSTTRSHNPGMNAINPVLREE